MIVLSNASTPPLELLYEAAPFLHSPANFSLDTSPYIDCQIFDWNKSPSAQLFLVWHETIGQQLVIKMMCPYRDTRYSLETLKKRQQCLLEALERNRVFSPELYIGLAPLYSLNLKQKTISIGRVIENPTSESLEEHTEYVLLMKPQDEETRLDYVLAKANTTSLMPLVQYVIDIHKHKVFDIPLEDCIRWGNYYHLTQKLEHNLELLDFLATKCSESDWDDREELAMRVMAVKNAAQEMASQECYHRYFQLRIDEGCIKLCHGDIKSPHIWIASDGCSGEQAWSFNILDAIDFNPMYNHIDILSDFAMLIADIQARTQSPALVKELVDYYLCETNQDNEVARAVLDYYLIDKAIVGTGISILYDGKPELGRAFLKVAEDWLGSKCAASMSV